MSPSSSARVFLDVVTSSGASACLELRILSERVDVWRGTGCAAIFDRDHLRGWLEHPEDRLGIGDVTLSLDRHVDVEGRIAIAMPDIHGWALTPRIVTDLRHHL